MQPTVFMEFHLNPDYGYVTESKPKVMLVLNSIRSIQRSSTLSQMTDVVMDTGDVWVVAYDYDYVKGLLLHNVGRWANQDFKIGKYGEYISNKTEN